MKIYKKCIKKCWDCPNKGYGFTSLKCKKEDNRKIEDGDTIPYWCPLEDYNENNN